MTRTLRGKTDNTIEGFEFDEMIEHPGEYDEAIINKIVKRRKRRRERPLSKKKQIDNLTYRLKVCQDELARVNAGLAAFRGLITK